MFKYTSKENQNKLVGYIKESKKQLQRATNLIAYEDEVPKELSSIVGSMDKFINKMRKE